MIIFEIEVGLLQCDTGKFEQLVHHFYIKMKMNCIQQKNFKLPIDNPVMILYVYICYLYVSSYMLNYVRKSKYYL